MSHYSHTLLLNTENHALETAEIRESIQPSKLHAIRDGIESQEEKACYTNIQSRKQETPKCRNRRKLIKRAGKDETFFSITLKQCPCAP